MNASVAVPLAFSLVVGYALSLRLFQSEEGWILPLTPVVGALALAAAAPALRISPSVSYGAIAASAAYAIWKAADDRALGRVFRRDVVIAMFPSVLLSAIFMLERPLIASWTNPDEQFHFSRSITFALTGRLPLDYPPLIHLIGASSRVLIPGDLWIAGYRMVLASLIPAQSGLLYLIARRLWGERPAIAAAWSHTAMASSVRHLFVTGTYSNMLADTLVLTLGLALVERRQIPVAAFGLLLPMAHSSTLYTLGFLAIVSLAERDVLLALPIVATLVAGAPLAPAMVGRLSNYAQWGSPKVLADVPPRYILRELIGSLRLMGEALGPWSAFGLGGLMARRGRVERWLATYAGGLMVLTFFGYSGVAFAGEGWRFAFQLSMPLTLTAGLALDRLLSLSRRVMTPLILVGVTLALVASPPVEPESQLPIWRDIREFCGATNGTPVAVIADGPSNYLRFVGCNVVEVFHVPWSEGLLEPGRIVAVSANVPLWYRPRLPCFEQLYSSEYVLAYRPVPGCIPPRYRVTACEALGERRVVLDVLLVSSNVSAEIAKRPENWVVYANGGPCEVSSVELEGEGALLSAGDSVKVEVSCDLPLGVEPTFALYGPGLEPYIHEINCTSPGGLP